MPVNGQEFFDQKVWQFGAQASHVKFSRNYVMAVNNTLDDYAVELDRQSDPTHITSNTADIPVDVNRRNFLDAGVTYYLCLYGHTSGELSLDAAWENYEQAKATARGHRDMETAAAATDGEVIGMFDA